MFDYIELCENPYHADEKLKGILLYLKRMVVSPEERCLSAILYTIHIKIRKEAHYGRSYH